MKETAIILALIAIAFMLGWIWNELQDIKEVQKIPDIISATMRAEFQFERDFYKLVNE